MTKIVANRILETLAAAGVEAELDHLADTDYVYAVRAYDVAEDEVEDLLPGRHREEAGPRQWVVF